MISALAIISHFFMHPAYGQAMQGPPGIAPSGISRFATVYNIPVAIPAIAAAGLGSVTVTVPGVKPGDTIEDTLASGSVAIPALVFEAYPYTVGTNQVTLRYGNDSGLAASTATTVTLNITYWGP